MTMLLPGNKLTTWPQKVTVFKACHFVFVINRTETTEKQAIASSELLIKI